MSTPYSIPFNRPSLAGREWELLADALRRRHISGDGHYSKACQALLQRQLGAAGVLVTTSCTHALEMAGLLLDLQPGDEVIVPSFTFVTSASAFALRGARPVFCDVRPDTLNLDERQLEALVTPRTKAIVVVHYAGVGCAMDEILAIAARHGVPVVEDNAHGLFGRYKGRPLGSLGCLATQSFHETKNISCGEGGALVLNDASLVERAEIIREKGTNRSRFFRGQVDKYSWVGLGSSYVISDLLAAYLLAQLEAAEAIQQSRRTIWQRYAAELSDWAARHGVRLPVVPAECEQSWHMFYLLLPGLAARQALIGHLREAGILGVFHYQPLNCSEMGQQYGGRPGACPVAERAGDTLLRLPLFNDMTAEEQGRVIERVLAFLPAG